MPKTTEDEMMRLLKTIDAKLTEVLKRTDPRVSAGASAEEVRRQLKEALSEDEEGRPYVGIETHLNQ